MNKKTLSARILVSLFFTFCVTLLSGQNVIRFSPQRATQEEDLIYRDQFKQYTLATLPTETTTALLRTKNYFDELIIETKGNTFSFNLEAHDLRPAHYKLRVRDEFGTHELPRSPNKTYRGFTTDGHYDVRITADDHFFYALIEQGNDAFYIEPANNINPDAPADQFIMYWGSDNLKKMNEDQC